MSPTDIMVLSLILAGFGAFIVTLAWVSRPPRRAGKHLAEVVGSDITRQTGDYSVSH
jgi:hypothetical protein